MSRPVEVFEVLDDSSSLVSFDDVAENVSDFGDEEEDTNCSGSESPSSFNGREQETRLIHHKQSTPAVQRRDNETQSECSAQSLSAVEAATQVLLETVGGKALALAAASRHRHLCSPGAGESPFAALVGSIRKSRLLNNNRASDHRAPLCTTSEVDHTIKKSFHVTHVEDIVRALDEVRCTLKAAASICPVAGSTASEAVAQSGPVVDETKMQRLTQVIQQVLQAVAVALVPSSGLAGSTRHGSTEVETPTTTVETKDISPSSLSEDEQAELSQLRTLRAELGVVCEVERVYSFAPLYKELLELRKEYHERHAADKSHATFRVLQAHRRELLSELSALETQRRAHSEALFQALSNHQVDGATAERIQTELEKLCTIGKQLREEQRLTVASSASLAGGSSPRPSISLDSHVLPNHDASLKTSTTKVSSTTSLVQALQSRHEKELHSLRSAVRALEAQKEQLEQKVRTVEAAAHERLTLQLGEDEHVVSQCLSAAWRKQREEEFDAVRKVMSCLIGREVVGLHVPQQEGSGVNEANMARVDVLPLPNTADDENGLVSLEVDLSHAGMARALRLQSAVKSQMLCLRLAEELCAWQRHLEEVEQEGKMSTGILETPLPLADNRVVTAVAVQIGLPSVFTEDPFDEAVDAEPLLSQAAEVPSDAPALTPSSADGGAEEVSVIADATEGRPQDDEEHVPTVEEVQNPAEQEERDNTISEEPSRSRKRSRSVSPSDADRRDPLPRIELAVTPLIGSSASMETFPAINETQAEPEATAPKEEDAEEPVDRHEEPVTHFATHVADTEPTPLTSPTGEINVAPEIRMEEASTVLDETSVEEGTAPVAAKQTEDDAPANDDGSEEAANELADQAQPEPTPTPAPASAPAPAPASAPAPAPASAPASAPAPAPTPAPSITPENIFTEEGFWES